ncbi:MAG: Calx-beta domain-containing protein [Acidimicrobiales bacterium]
MRRNNRPRRVALGVLGALAATQAFLLAPAAQAATEGDIVFVVDESGSMGPVQSAVRANLASMTDQIDSSGIDARYGLVGYGSVSSHGAETGHTHTDLTTKAPFQAELNNLIANGGAEPAFSAIVHAGNLSFRPNAKACFVLITDEDADAGATQAQAQATLAGVGATFFGIFNPNFGTSSADFNPLAAATGGQNFVLSNFVNNPGPVLTALGNACAAAITGAISLGPASATNDVGTTHTVTATLRDANNNPIVGAVVSFNVVTGPNAASPGTCSVNANCTSDGGGQVSFTYLGDGGPGTDTIEACFTDASGARRCARATKEWVQRTEIAINDVSVLEGDSGLTPAVFTVSLSAPSPAAVSVAFATSNGSAQAGSDYVGTNGTVVFPPNTTSRAVTVNVIGDTVNEPDETFFVNLSGPVGATIADPQGVGRILDEDRDGAFSCRATALRLLASERAVANPANLPCADDDAALASATLSSGLVSVSALTLSASTDQTPDDLESTDPAIGDNAVAEAGVEQATVRVGSFLTLANITARAVRAEATVECAAGPSGLVPALSGSSTIASLTINGVAVNVNGTATVNLPLGLGTVSVNRTVTTATSLTRQAIVISVLGIEVVIGEARANFTGNPCTA